MKTYDTAKITKYYLGCVLSVNNVLLSYLEYALIFVMLCGVFQQRNWMFLKNYITTSATLIFMKYTLRNVTELNLTRGSQNRCKVQCFYDNTTLGIISWETVIRWSIYHICWGQTVKHKRLCRFWELIWIEIICLLVFDPKLRTLRFSWRSDKDKWLTISMGDISIFYQQYLS